MLEEVWSLPILINAYQGWERHLVWSHPVGAVYRLLSGRGDVHFLKLTNRKRAFPLKAEADRLRWAHQFTRVPEVLGEGSTEGIDWLITKGLDGQDATTPELLADPVRLVSSLARGLRRFHDSLPVEQCPFDFRLELALNHVRTRFEAGLMDLQDLHDDHGELTVPEAIQTLEAARPESEDLVVCHGDYCFPNALLVNWEVSGYLDLGELGIADRWWDVAVGSWSTVWNVGPGYEELFLESYGIRPNTKRMRFYRLLYDLTS